MRNGFAARHFRSRAFLVDMDPLFIAGRSRKPGDAILRHLDPVADADTMPTVASSRMVFDSTFVS
jgi:hypothetical protein